jgi:hypothetical protein
MSVYYNQDLTKRREKDKRHHDLIAALREGPTGLGPASWTWYTMVDRRGTSAENVQKGDSPGLSPTPNQDPALSAKVTTGGLSATPSPQPPHLQIDSEVPPPMDWWVQPPIHPPLLGINVKEPRGSHNGRKTKGHFPVRQWSPFLCLTFLSRSPVQWQKLLFGANLASP